MIYERPFRQCVPQSVVYPRNPLYITMSSPSTLTVPLASGQRKISMATPTAEKVKNQPSGWGRLADRLAMVTQVGQCLSACLVVGGAANALALMVWSGVCLSSFSAEPPQIPGVGGKARITPFILVIKTDQMVDKNAPDAKEEAEKKAEQDAKRGLPVAKAFFTSDPNQFRLTLHPFARYNFTIDWGDGTKEIVRSDAPAGKAIIDEAWLAQVKKGLEQPVTVDFENIPPDFPVIGDPAGPSVLSYLLGKAGIDLCADIIEVPNIWLYPPNEGISLPGPRNVPLKVEAMKLGDVFKLLTKLTGLTYVLHDRALLYARHKDIPSFVCPQHTYAKAGTYTVKITENVIGGFPQIYFNGGYDCVKVMDLAQWGGNRWKTMDKAFKGCVNMTISASDTATAVTGAVREFSKAWYDCRGLTSFPLLNTAAGTNFDSTWSGCSGLTSFPLLNTSAGRYFGAAWNGCSGLTSFPLLNTAAGTNFGAAWNDCSGLTSFPLLSTAAGTSFGSAWEGCSGLTSFPLLNTSAGTSFTRTWSECSGLTSFPLLNTAAATSFSVTWQGCSGLTSFPLLNTSAATHFRHAWSGCSGLTSFPLLNTAAATSFEYAWYKCSGLTSFPLLNTYAGTDFSGAWRGCSGLMSFPELSTSSGTDFDSAWSKCSGLTSFPWLDTSGGKNFDQAWYGCRGLTSFPLLNFGKMEKAERCFFGVTLTSASYGELLANIAALNKTPKVTFDGGNSKASDQNGIQAREKLIKNLSWTIVDGDTARRVSPALPQPLPQEANDF